MSFFALAFQKYLDANDTTATRFSKLAGITQQDITRLSSGARVRKDKLARIMHAVTDETARRSLLLAWVRDGLPDELKQYAAVNLEEGGRVKESPPPFGVNLSDEDAAVIRYWAAECARDPDVGKFLNWLADSRRGGPAKK